MSGEEEDQEGDDDYIIEGKDKSTPSSRGEKRHRCNFRTTDLDLYLWHVSRLQVPEQRALAEQRANTEEPVMILIFK